jgi:hypothetical protein
MKKIKQKELKVELISQPESSDILTLASRSANYFVQEVLSTHSDKCARTPDQKAQIIKLAMEARNAIDDFLIRLAEKDRPPRSEFDVNDGNPEGW